MMMSKIMEQEGFKTIPTKLVSEIMCSNKEHILALIPMIESLGSIQIS